MLHGEPEYRRRRREEAAKNQHYAEREWDEATQQRNTVEIVAAIKAVVEKLDRGIDEKTPKNKDDRRRHWWEILGLWVAAAVGVGAILVGNHDASEQRSLMQGQLDEMQTQSAIQRFETKADIRLGFARGMNNGIITVATKWTNAGKSDALHVKDWDALALLALSDNVSKNETTLGAYDFMHPPTGSPPEVEEHILRWGEEEKMLPKMLPRDLAADTAAHRRLPIIYGYIEYSDIFGTFYTIRFCRTLDFQPDGSGGIVMAPAAGILSKLPCERSTEKAVPRRLAN